MIVTGFRGVWPGAGAKWLRNSSLNDALREADGWQHRAILEGVDAPIWTACFCAPNNPTGLLPGFGG